MPLSHSSTSLLSSPLIAAAIFLFSGYLPPSFSQNVIYPDCDRTFTCGSLQNISYPFIGGDRPDHCGLPEFKLSCHDNHAAEFTTNSETYRVLQINQTSKTLTLARLDMWNNSCPKSFTNSTFNSSIFDTNFGNDNLTLTYGCNSPMTVTPYNQFSCNVSGANSSFSYYLVGPVPTDPILRIVTCFVSVQIPMLRDAALRLTGNLTTLPEVLTEGFNVNYIDPYDKQCSDCVGSGGECGFDPDFGEPVCICGSGLCPVQTNEG